MALQGINGNFISVQQLTELFIEVNTAFSQFTWDEATVADKISYMAMDSMGDSISVPLSPVAGKEVEWPEGESRKYGAAEVIKFVVKHTRFCAPNEYIYATDLIRDKYGLLQGKLAAIAGRAKRTWDRKLAALILQNGLGYDNVSFFNTVHPVNPLNTSLGNYSNDLAGVDIDQPGFSQALDALKKIRWIDGNIMNADDTGIIIVVPTKQLELKARQLLFGSLTPNVYGANTAAAGVSNPFMGLKGMAREVIYLPELDNLSGSGKQWYLLNCTDVVRPLITSIGQQPVFNYAGLDPSEWVRVDKGAITYGWDAFGGVGYGPPQLAVRCTAP
jgi:hypothetical protein